MCFHGSAVQTRWGESDRINGPIHEDPPNGVMKYRVLTERLSVCPEDPVLFRVPTPGLPSTVLL